MSCTGRKHFVCGCSVKLHRLQRKTSTPCKITGTLGLAVCCRPDLCCLCTAAPASAALAAAAAAGWRCISSAAGSTAGRSAMRIHRARRGAGTPPGRGRPAPPAALATASAPATGSAAAPAAEISRRERSGRVTCVVFPPRRCRILGFLGAPRCRLVLPEAGGNRTRLWLKLRRPRANKGLQSRLKVVEVECR